MQEPKFKEGQAVKYTVGKQVQYNTVLEPVWNSSAGCYLYRLNEPMALPVYRENWLEAVDEADELKLKNAYVAGKVRLHSMGYITIDEGE